MAKGTSIPRTNTSSAARFWSFRQPFRRHFSGSGRIAVGYVTADLWAMADQLPEQSGHGERVPVGVWDRLITEALAIIPKELKGLIGLMLGIFLFIAVCLIAMYGFMVLIKAMPK